MESTQKSLRKIIENSPNTDELNNALADNPYIKEKVSREIKKYIY